MTSPKKKIVVSVSKTDNGKDKRRQAVACDNYVDWLKTEFKGYEIWPVDPSYRKKVLRATEAGEVAGLVYTGGVDVDPKFYGEERSQHTGNPNVPRDQFEAMLFDLLHPKRVPILGICRGIQFVNAKMGGKIRQHIGDGHRRLAKNKDQVHKVTFKPSTRLATLFKQPTVDVNSAHHQAVDPKHIAKGLRVAATGKEGSTDIVEALEHADDKDSYILLVQWHPERMKSSPVAKKILVDFREAVEGIVKPAAIAEAKKKPATKKKATKKK